MTPLQYTVLADVCMEPLGLIEKIFSWKHLGD